MKRTMVAAAAFVLVLCACSGKSPAPEAQKTDTAAAPVQAAAPAASGAAQQAWGNAPDFTLKTVTGGSVTLSKLGARMVILNFWATWCPPCRQEIPDFIELYNKYSKKGLAIVGVSLDQSGAAAVKEFVLQNGMNYPVAMGDDALAKAYGGMNGIPTTFIIDAKGNIVNKYIGLRSLQVFQGEIDKYLK